MAGLSLPRCARKTLVYLLRAGGKSDATISKRMSEARGALVRMEGSGLIENGRDRETGGKLCKPGTLSTHDRRS